MEDLKCNLPQDWYQILEDPKTLKHVLYSDSVSGDGRIVFIFNNKKNILTFDELWNFLISSNKYNLQTFGDKEYIFFSDDGFKVLNFDLINDHAVYSIPKYLMRHKISKEIVKINFSNLQNIKITKDHSLVDILLDQKQFIKKKYNEIKYIPFISETQNINLTDIDFDLFLLGVFYGDGNYSNYYPQISFNNIDKNINFFKEVFNKTIKIYRKNENDAYINYKPLKKLLDDNALFKKKSVDRTITKNLVNVFSNDFKKFFSFLLGYWAADGSYSSRKFEISSGNKKLINQIQTLCLIHNIFSVIKKDSNNRKYNSKIFGDMYKISLTGLSDNIFTIFKHFLKIKDIKVPVNFCGCFYGSGTSKQHPHITRKFNNSKLINIRPIKIKNFEFINYSGYVYDFEIPSNHTFVVDGLVVHNTDSIFIHFKEDCKDDVKKMVSIVHKTSEDINKLVVDYNQLYLLPRCGYSPNQNQTFFKEELVLDTIMFLDVKKTYAYRLRAKEAKVNENNELVGGKILDEPEIVPTSNLGVKTNTIKLTNEILDSLLKIALDKNADPKERIKLASDSINKTYNEFKKQVESFEFKNIADPVKMGKVLYVKYSMELYNTIIEPVFENTSAGFFIYCKFGDKNKLNNLNMNFDLEKLTGITVPYEFDKEKIISAFKEYSISIDIEKQWEKILSTTCHRVIDLFKQSV